MSDQTLQKALVRYSNEESKTLANTALMGMARYIYPS